MSSASGAPAPSSASTPLPRSRLYTLLAKLEKPGPRAAVITLGILLVLPGVFTGFALDDYLLLLQLNPRGDAWWAGGGPFDIFRWIDPEHVRGLIDHHGLPWWTYDQTRLAFLRPLGSLTHAFDYAFWPNSPLAMHVHNWLWFGVLMAVMVAAYRRLIANPWTLGVAIAMFAFDSPHAAPASWISNRNAIISAVFVVLAVLAHHRSREREGVRFAFIASVCFSLGLLAAEAGVAAAGYLIAYALFYDRAPGPRRLASLAPYGALLIGWACLRSAGDYGASGGFNGYIDPKDDLLGFMQQALMRPWMLLASQAVKFSSDFYSLAGVSERPLVATCGALLCGGVGYFLWPSLRDDRSTRFFFGGAVLATLPMVGALPSDRMLIPISFGLTPAIAEGVRRGLEAGAATVTARADTVRRGVAILLTVLHLGVDPLLLPNLSAVTLLFSHKLDALVAAIPAQSATGDRVVIIAQMPESAFLMYVAAAKAQRGEQSAPLYWLMSADTASRFERRSDNVLRVTNERGLFSERWEERSPSHPLTAGERVELSELTVAVIQVSADGRPTQVDFSFHSSLDASRYVWLTWRDAKLVPFHPPP